MSNTKQCCECGESKPLSEYKPNPYKADGVDRYCKQCRSERRAFYKKLEATA